MSLRTVTTSWDDGHVLDLRLAQLLRSHNLPATFYLAPKNHEIAPEDMLTEAQIRLLDKHFEIGAHTMTHTSLPSLSDDIAKKEITDSKLYLESVVRSPITSFCYPRGEFDKKHRDMVDQAGFTYARSVEVDYRLKDVSDDLAAPTTIHAYSHLSHIPRIARFAGFSPVATFRYMHWDDLAIAVFDKMLSGGGIYHLWGHSWEIDKNSDWDRLGRVFAHISGRAEVVYKTNRELV